MSIIHELNKLARETALKTGRRPETIRLTVEQWDAVKSEAEACGPLKFDPAISGNYLFGIPVHVYATREELERAYTLDQHAINPAAMFKHDWREGGEG